MYGVNRNLHVLKNSFPTRRYSDLWVVPRADCQYRRTDLSGLPPRHRDAAAKLAATRHRPTPDAVTHIAWRDGVAHLRSEEHTSELQSLMRYSYAVFCL